MTFKGSRSYLKKSKTEILNVFLVSKSAKIDYALVCLLRNLGEIFNYLRIDKKYKDNDFRSALEIICNFLYYGEFKEQE